MTLKICFYWDFFFKDFTEFVLLVNIFKNIFTLLLQIYIDHFTYLIPACNTIKIINYYYEQHTKHDINKTRHIKF